MANQKLCALAFALAVVSVNADNCKRIAKYASLKTTLTNLYCPDNTMTCDSTTCSCSGCCEVTPDTCEHIKTTACGTDRTYTSNADTRAAAATTANFDTTCCVAKPTCGGYTCTAGYKKKSSIDSTKCMMHTCTDTECCDPDTDKCYGLYATAAANCGTVRTWPGPTDMSKYGVAATSANFQTTCCDTTTTTTQPLCSAHSCNAWEKAMTGTTGTTACGGTAYNGQTVAMRCGSICCELDETKCMGAKVHLNTSTAQQCDTTAEFEDSAKYAVAVSTAAAWKGACCTAKTTCTAFKSHSYAGSASGAEKMQKPAAAGLLLLIQLAGAVFTFAK